MDCPRCTKLPEIYLENCQVYVGLTLGHLKAKISKVLDNFAYDYQCFSNYFTVKSPSFERLISHLTQHSTINSLERKEISVLPLREGESFCFSCFARMKTLHHWSSLFNSRDLLYVLKNKTLTTHFQPIVDVDNNEIFGYEALARGVGTDGSLISPFKLFSTAKEADLLFNLDRQCRETNIKNAALHGIDKKIFINFIPTAIYEPTQCLQTTNAAVKSSNLSSSQIVFEVTETELVNDYGHLKKILDHYKDQGYSVALDDVGSGYTSVNTFMALTPDIIKIDMNIVRGIHANSTNQFILDTILSLSKMSNVRILAEGVETIDEFQYLKAKNISLMQGYYIGKPSDTPQKIHLS